MSRFHIARRPGLVARCCSWLVSVCLLVPTDLMANVPAQPQMAPLLAALENEQRQLAKSFDRETLLDELDYDAEQIAAYVSDTVVFQSYPGLLRGIDGTLSGMAGNAHDQAITLAGLLNDAGYEAQILSATLSAEQAASLHAAMTQPSLQPANGVAQSADSLKRLEANTKLRGSTVQALQQITDQTARPLTAALAQVDIRFDDQAMAAQSRSSARSYRWVRYRNAAGEPWVEVHPAHSAAARWSLQPAAVTAGTIVDEDLQTLGLEVWIEDSDGKAVSVTGRWQAPTANLHGRTLELEIVSNSMVSSNDLSDMDALVADSEYFFVRINNSLPERGLVFDLQGNTYAGDSIAGINTIFANLNKTGRRAADALSQLGTTTAAPAPRKQLSRVWVNFVLEAPGLKPREIQRVIYDAAAASAPAAVSLLQRWDIGVATTVATAAWHQYQKSKALQQAIVGYQTFQDAVQRQRAAGNDADVTKLVQLLAKHTQRPEQGRLTYLRGVFDQFDVGSDALRYISAPNILAIRTGVAKAEGSWRRYTMTDIVSNAQSAFRQGAQGWVSAPLLNLQRGVWETRVETLHLLDAPANAAHTSAYAELAGQQKFKPMVSTVDGVANIAPHVQGDVPAWWQLDLQTGSVIGMAVVGPGNGGVELTEGTLLEVVPFMLSAAFWVVAQEFCIQAGGDALCCITVNAALALGGFAISWAVGIVAVAAIEGAAFSAVAGPQMLSIISGVLADIGLTQAPVNCQ